jgi:hypothetical protein
LANDVPASLPMAIQSSKPLFLHVLGRLVRSDVFARRQLIRMMCLMIGRDNAANAGTATAVPTPFTSVISKEDFARLTEKYE